VATEGNRYRDCQDTALQRSKSISFSLPSEQPHGDFVEREMTVAVYNGCVRGAERVPRALWAICDARGFFLAGNVKLERDDAKALVRTSGAAMFTSAWLIDARGVEYEIVGEMVACMLLATRARPAPPRPRKNRPNEGSRLAIREQKGQ
jgi:hypothetical protein